MRTDTGNSSSGSSPLSKMDREFPGKLRCPHFGTPPDYPASGVSWYEAAAYAAFAGKELPTLYDWYAAAGYGPDSQIVSLSNFGGTGPMPAGANMGLAPTGTYDMAGNVKEWVENPSDQKRYMLGGGWTEPSYMFHLADARSPFERESPFGFR